MKRTLSERYIIWVEAERIHGPYLVEKGRKNIFQISGQQKLVLSQDCKLSSMTGAENRVT